MRKMFGVLGAAVAAAVGTLVIRTTASSAQVTEGTWVAYGYNDQTHKYGCLTSACPGGWCCWIVKGKT